MKERWTRMMNSNAISIEKLFQQLVFHSVEYSRWITEKLNHAKAQLRQFIYSLRKRNHTNEACLYIIKIYKARLWLLFYFICCDFRGRRRRNVLHSSMCYEANSRGDSIGSAITSIRQTADSDVSCALRHLQVDSTFHPYQNRMILITVACILVFGPMVWFCVHVCVCVALKCGYFVTRVQYLNYFVLFRSLRCFRFHSISILLLAIRRSWDKSQIELRTVRPRQGRRKEIRRNEKHESQFARFGRGVFWFRRFLRYCHFEVIIESRKDRVPVFRSVWIRPRGRLKFQFRNNVSVECIWINVCETREKQLQYWSV